MQSLWGLFSTASHRGLLCYISKLVYCDGIFVPRDRASFSQHPESRPLDRSSEISVLIGFANTTEWDRNQSDLPYLTLNMRRVPGRRGLPVLEPGHPGWNQWNRPQVAILSAD